MIETHDETGSGSGGHEELYLVTEGRAAFTVGDDEMELEPGEMVFVDPETTRGAKALEAGTTVLVFAGRPGDALPVSPFEHWYAAIPAREAGDYDTAYATIEKAFGDYPGHPRVHFELACLRALQGRRDEALEHLGPAIEGRTAVREVGSRGLGLRRTARRPGIRQAGLVTDERRDRWETP